MVMLILLLLFIFVMLVLPLLLKRPGELVVIVVMLHFLVLLTAPGDGGRWGALALFLLGCFDCGLWLFRRELSNMVQREDGSGLIARFGIVLSPIAIAFLTTFVLSVCL